MIKETTIKGLFILDHKVYNDSRGEFKEIFRKQSIQNNVGYDFEFCQENSVKSVKNVLRGLHFQKEPFAQSKLITVISGKILDVVVDIRKKSDTYGSYFSMVLSSEDNYSLFVPRGMAHGYLTIENETIINYKVDNYYNPKYESGISYNDTFLNIDWGVKMDNLIISKKDCNYIDFEW